MSVILVVGGAGYIGSHMVKNLHLSGHKVVTLDNLSTGFRDAVLYGEFVEADLADREALEGLFATYSFDGVMHFASSSLVAESVTNPALYYRNNVANTQNLLDAMVSHRVNNLVFSSSAAIFGEPVSIPIDETHPKNPINPYGQTKLIVERMLLDYEVAYNLRSISLRYFNAAGADPDGELGERHNPETHLIPIILQVASGRRERITVYGNDYETRDGTCIRDYIHIEDLCAAHRLAMDKLYSGSGSTSYNLGNGDGYSVLEIIQAVEEVTGRKLNVVYGERRQGDPAVLISDSACARDELGWEPVHRDIRRIVEHAWAWESMQAGIDRG